MKIELRTVRTRIHKPKDIPDLDALPASALLPAAPVAKMLSVADPTLKLWRREGRGPRFIMIEKRPRYRVGDLRDWLQASAATSSR